MKPPDTTKDAEDTRPRSPDPQFVNRETWRPGIGMSPKTAKFLAFRDDEKGWWDLADKDARRVRRWPEGMPTARQIPVRSSYIGDLAKCPRYFLFRDRCGLQLKGAISDALDIGTMYHWFLEAAIRAWDQPSDAQEEIALRFASAEMEKMNGVLGTFANDVGLLPTGEALDKVLATREKNFRLAQMMFQLGFPVFFRGKFMEDWEPIGVEVLIQAKRPPLKSPVWAKPDVILQRKSDPSEIAIVNHKTTSHEAGTLAASYVFDSQAQLEQLLTARYYEADGKRLVYYIHNMTRKCTLRYPAAKYKTFEDYVQKCIEWYDDKRKEDPDSPPFARSVTVVPPKIMDLELWVKMQEVSRAAHSPPNLCVFYRNSASCMNYGKLCPFYSLCSTSPAKWPSIIESKFHIHHREDDELEQLQASQST